MDTHLTTPRLTIRPLAPRDAAALVRYRSDAEVKRYQGWEPASEEEVLTFLAGQPEDGLGAAGQWVQLALEVRSTAELAGDVGVHVQVDDPHQAEVGITLAPPFQGQGLATEALGAVVAHLLGTLGKHRVFASVDPRNHPSMALMERVGMRKEAHHVQSLWFKGEWVDDVIYALLRAEFTDE